MTQAFDSLFVENPAERTYRQLLMVRAALVGIPLAKASPPDSLQEAAFTLDGLCEGLFGIVDELAKRGTSDIVTSLCLTARVGLTQVQRELARQALDPYHALVRARSMLLKSLTLITELEDAVARRRGELPDLLDPVDVARALVLMAVRANSTDHAWIIHVAETELNFLAVVPKHRMDQAFRRKLGELRALVVECTNYEARKTLRAPERLA